MYRFTAALCCAALLTACSSHPPTPPPPPAGEFESQTSSNGIKLFTYSEKMQLPRAKIVRQTVDPQTRAAEMARFHPQEQMKRVEFNLKRDPRLKEFCPSGYTPIEQYAVLDEVVIRGECIYQELNTAGK